MNNMRIIGYMKVTQPDRIIPCSFQISKVIERIFNINAFSFQRIFCKDKSYMVWHVYAEFAGSTFVVPVYVCRRHHKHLKKLFDNRLII